MEPLPQSWRLRSMTFSVRVIGLLLVVVACGGDQVGADSAAGSTTTTVEPTGPADSPSVSSDACGLVDPWGTVETAFVGIVASVETRVNEQRQFELEERGLDPVVGEWPWVTFEVDRWFTTDFGTTFSMWAPGFEGSPGESWQIAGALYWVVDEQSGEVFSCLSQLASESEATEWEDRFGGSVAAGSGSAETPADPDLLAEIEENRQLWDSRHPESYTAIVSTFRGRQPVEECGGSSSVRVVVEEGEPVEAVDLRRLCRVSDPADAYTVEDTFDLAVEAAGALEGDVVFDEKYGFIRGFYASDRSIEASAAVDLLADTAVPVILGTEGSLAAAEEARTRWDESAVDSYTMDVEIQCFCAMAGNFEVTVNNGEVEEMRKLDGLDDVVQPDTPAFELTVEWLLGSITAWSSSTPDSVVAGFHEAGYPVDIHIDVMENVIDDELTVLVRRFSPTD